jgi:hypothetical protein
VFGVQTLRAGSEIDIYGAEKRFKVWILVPRIGSEFGI